MLGTVTFRYFDWGDLLFLSMLGFLLGIATKLDLRGRYFAVAAARIWLMALHEGAKIGLAPSQSPPSTRFTGKAYITAKEKETVQTVAEDQGATQRRPIDYSSASPLWFYNEAAEHLYRIGALEAEREFEGRIQDTEKKGLDPPAVRAFVLAVSARRLFKIDSAASSCAWEQALVAARQVNDFIKREGNATVAQPAHFLHPRYWFRAMNQDRCNPH